MMKLLSIVSALACVVTAERYNILSIESGDFSALVMADFVNFMEQRSYMLAKKRQCLPGGKPRDE